MLEDEDGLKTPKTREEKKRKEDRAIMGTADFGRRCVLAKLPHQIDVFQWELFLLPLCFSRGRPTEV